MVCGVCMCFLVSSVFPNPVSFAARVLAHSFLGYMINTLSAFPNRGKHQWREREKTEKFSPLSCNSVFILIFLSCFESFWQIIWIFDIWIWSSVDLLAQFHTRFYPRKYSIFRYDKLQTDCLARHKNIYWMVIQLRQNDGEKEEEIGKYEKKKNVVRYVVPE